jgi:hypothetical protein
MQTSAYQPGPPEVPGMTGHQMQVKSYTTCLPCHPLPELLADFTTTAISNQIQQVKANLDYWAQVKAPPQLWTNYGVRSWEYTVPGTLSNPSGVGPPGPSTADQALIPNKIKKARFNLYVVLQDGSYGVHNAPYCTTLLEAARYYIRAELNQ